MSNNVVAGALCSPHLLYAFIWYALDAIDWLTPPGPSLG